MVYAVQLLAEWSSADSEWNVDAVQAWSSFAEEPCKQMIFATKACDASWWMS